MSRSLVLQVLPAKMKGLEGMGLLGLWHWFHLLRTLTHNFALCICWVYKSRNDNLVPREHTCCHRCSPSIEGDYDLSWDKPGLAKWPASRMQIELAPAEVSFWEKFLMLPESRPIRKVIWQKNPQSTFKSPLCRCAWGTVFHKQICQNTNLMCLDHFQTPSFFLSCYLLNYWDFPQMVISRPHFLVSDIWNTSPLKHEC